MKRSSKIVLVTVITLGVVGAVAARQYDGEGCGFGPGGEPGGWVAKKIAWRLDLNDSQQAELDVLRAQVVDNMKQMREQRPSSEEVQALLGETLDQDRALAMLDDKLQRARDNAPEMIAAFAGFYDALDADQKAELGEMIQRRLEQGPRHWGGHRGGRHDWGYDR